MFFVFLPLRQGHQKEKTQTWIICSELMHRSMRKEGDRLTGWATMLAGGVTGEAIT